MASRVWIGTRMPVFIAIRVGKASCRLNANSVSSCGGNMFRKFTLAFVLAALCAVASPCQTKLSPKWEELTAADFRDAIVQSKGVCMLPFGIIEKHGPHLPLGTDLLNVRYAALHAAEKEFAIVFPEYYFGQIFEAKHEPGTVAYSRGIQLNLLQETTDEMARNGCKKIVIVNGHGGNESLLPFFAQSQLDKPHDYVVYIQSGERKQMNNPLRKDPLDMHAGQSETSNVMVAHPELVHPERATSESGADQARQKIPADVYTGIWWYTRFPFHYSGEGAAATRELGEYQMNWWVDSMVKAIQQVKADDVSPKLQKEFYEKSTHPLDT